MHSHAWSGCLRNAHSFELVCFFSASFNSLVDLIQRTHTLSPLFVSFFFFLSRFALYCFGWSGNLRLASSSKSNPLSSLRSTTTLTIATPEQIDSVRELRELLVSSGELSASATKHRNVQMYMTKKKTTTVRWLLSQMRQLRTTTCPRLSSSTGVPGGRLHCGGQVKCVDAGIVIISCSTIVQHHAR